MPRKTEAGLLRLETGLLLKGFLGRRDVDVQGPVRLALIN